jgi:signal transduction histidine kinase/CHASE3 domain sensor protein
MWDAAAMRQSLTTRMLAASALLACLVAAAFGILISALGDLRDSGRVSERSKEVTAAANELETLLLEIQAAARGYLISGDESHLGPWRRAQARVDDERQRLLDLITDERQEARAEAITRDIASFVRDYSAPLVRVASADPDRARRIFTAGDGRVRVQAIRAQFDRFGAAQHELSVAVEERTDHEARSALVFGAAGMGGSVLLIVMFAASLARAVVVPVRKVAEAADRVARGHLETRVDEGGICEVARLGTAFNAMASSLHAGQASLERALEDLRAEKERVEAFYRYAERIGGESHVPDLTRKILEELRQFAQAEVGALYIVDAVRHDGLFLLASHGVESGRLPEQVLAGRGPAYPDEAGVRHELHVPLRVLDRDVGVASLGRVCDRAFQAGEIEAIEHLADQAAVVLSNALSFRAARREASINRAVLDATVDGIRLVDLQGRTLLANRAIERLTTDAFGLPGDSTLHERSVIAERLTDPECYRETMAKIVADPECETQDEFELVDSGRSFQRYTGPVRDASGALVGRIIVVRGVTAEREAERLKDDFVATVSHELRTPLTSIRGYLELVLDGEAGELNEDQARFLAIAQRNADQLLRLVGDLLFVARVDVGKLALEHGEVDLAAVAFEAVEAARPLADARGSTLHLAVEPMPRLWGDQARLAQLLDNLISNAIKFSGERGRVEVTTERVNGNATISVSDNGIGIPTHEVERLFDRFFRSSSARSQAIPGTGLGLTIARAIVEGHGGSITIESHEGVGTTFRVELPLARPA